MEFILDLKSRNETLFYFGLINVIIALVCIILSKTNYIEYFGTNGWHKPIKFAISIAIYSWTLGWFSADTKWINDLNLFNWTIIITLGFEIMYIVFQASRGEQSHFNISSPSYALLYAMMAIAASIVSLAATYLAIKFFQNTTSILPDYYIWAIRLSLIIFTIFAFEGFVMGSRMSHTIGGEDGSPGLPFLNWSRVFGDPRVAHFIGMHSIQVIPIISFYFVKSTLGVVLISIAYLAFAIGVLIQAFMQKPFITY